MTEHACLKLKTEPTHACLNLLKETEVKADLAEAKQDLMFYQKALLKTKETAGPNNVFILDGNQLAEMTLAIEKTVSAYNACLEAALAQIPANTGLEEIKLVLNQIWQAVSKDSEAKQAAYTEVKRVLSKY